ncbi:hypothetical protein [Pseudoalteromonas sp. SR43-3]|uniref:hypothetical protein n=1 Tax=Pseudoalteromonas sp. SR43-3 TaxID=2760943 RepID=UPI001600F4BF|nr:hypothetical protein [Pseudoalteromonas sp. SR43-3]MBB1277443.1 hypothetical protein [Pseudoalteromonas sp. SR43-3]
MKYLTFFCHALFYAQLIFIFTFPIEDGYLFENWVLIVLLSVLLPIAYSISSFKQPLVATKVLPIKLNEFLVLFCLSVGLNVLSTQGFILKSNAVELEFDSSVNSAELFKRTYLDSEEKNRLHAQAIYQNYGVIVQFKLESGEYKDFNPSTLDVKKNKDNAASDLKISELKKWYVKQSGNAIYISLFQIFGFLLIAKSTLVWLNRIANKPIKQD